LLNKKLLSVVGDHQFIIGNPICCSAPISFLPSALPRLLYPISMLNAVASQRLLDCFISFQAKAGIFSSQAKAEIYFNFCLRACVRPFQMLFVFCFC
jgi:hypothetical protein